jgi:aerobic-type carbon monoxide dehydrogenase small subunit (CoxS/CutS family)
MAATIGFRVNGRPVTLEGGPGRSLLWALRGELALTGAKYGCGIGACGACTVLVEGRAVRSCLTTLGDVEDRDIETIEGLARGGELHPLQQAFVDHGALQCGYCTPGMILAAEALLRATPRPSREAIAAAMEPHLCRCGAHQRIVTAIESVSRPAGGAHE